MDYIQEDFDSMIKELEGWKSESVKYSDLLKTELEYVFFFFFFFFFFFIYIYIYIIY